MNGSNKVRAAVLATAAVALFAGAGQAQAQDHPHTDAPNLRATTTAVVAARAGVESAGQAVARVAPVIELPARGASIVIKAAEFEAARRNALVAAQAYGAELVSSRSQVTDKGRRHGDLQFRLPAPALPDFLTRLRTLGTLSGERLSTVDHGPEAASLGKRVGRLQEHEARLGGILTGERRLRGSDILFVQERLFRASVDESLLTQRREDLERDAQMCDVVLTVFEPVEATRAARMRRDVGRSFADGLSFARDSASSLLARALTLLAYFAVFAPLWVGAACLLWVGVRRVRRGSGRFMRP